ncbi:hypothetical protein TKK_0013353 [Trichogramma kaykai]
MATAAAAAAGASASATVELQNATGRLANLEFPPPPPYPPPRGNAKNNKVLFDEQTDIISEQQHNHHNVYQHRVLVHHTPRSVHDYSYAYYEAGVGSGAVSSLVQSPVKSCSSAANVRATPQEYCQQDFHLIQQAPPLQQPPSQQKQQQLQKQQMQPSHRSESSAPNSPQFVSAYSAVQDYDLQEYRTNPHKRHTYVTRYGTEENIYEEISEIK